MMTERKDDASKMIRPAIHVPVAPVPPVDDGEQRFLVCPVCGEMLAQPDVEVFSRCPYCDYKFAKDQAMEDFLLEPTVKAWVRSQEMLPPPFRMDDFIEP